MKSPASKIGYIIVLIGTFSFLMAILSSCEKEESENPFYLKYTMNGEARDFPGTDPSHYFTVSGGGGSSPPHDTSNIRFTTHIWEMNNRSIPSMSITFIRYVPREQIDSSGHHFKSYDDFQALFVPGTKEFSWGPCRGIDGIEIQYWDSNNVLWSSARIPCGMATPVASIDYSRFQYNIIYSRKYGIHPTRPDILVEAEFHCVLYNEDSDSLVIQNGRICSLYHEF